MLDTHAVARSLTDAELTPAQADAITNAVRLAAEQGDHVTSDQFKAGLTLSKIAGRTKCGVRAAARHRGRTQGAAGHVPGRTGPSPVR